LIEVIEPFNGAHFIEDRRAIPQVSARRVAGSDHLGRRLLRRVALIVVIYRGDCPSGLASATGANISAATIEATAT
jgi:hypothetical protein